MFYTQWKRPDKAEFYEAVDNTTVVETSGYVSAKQRIESLILAGKRLDNYRKEQYHFLNDDIDFNFSDPTTKKDFDEFQARDLRKVVNDNLKASKKAASDALKSTVQGSDSSSEDSGQIDVQSSPEPPKEALE